MPVRVQLSRKKGWRMPENTVKVTRPGIFGNPFYGGPDGRDTGIEVYLFRRWIFKALGLTLLEKHERGEFADFMESHATPADRTALKARAERMLTALPMIRGKNLACFCRLDQPCHADVLLELANK